MVDADKLLEEVSRILYKYETNGAIIGCAITVAPKNIPQLHEWDGRKFIHRKRYELILQPPPNDFYNSSEGDD